MLGMKQKRKRWRAEPCSKVEGIGILNLLKNGVDVCYETAHKALH